MGMLFLDLLNVLRDDGHSSLPVTLVLSSDTDIDNLLLLAHLTYAYSFGNLIYLKFDCFGTLFSSFF